MRWRIVPKNATPSLPGNDYRLWKPLLAKEADRQCVYCCIHESKYGGTRNFHVEHFRPKSRRPDLINSYENLFYACGVCNILKSDDWPSELGGHEFSEPGYPDPSQVNYGDILSVDTRTGKVKSEWITGRYLIERLHLNRGHVLGLRLMLMLMDRIGHAIEEFEELRRVGAVSGDEKDQVMDLLVRMVRLQASFSAARPYSVDQLK